MAFGAWLAIIAAAVAPASLERGPVVTQTTDANTVISFAGPGTTARLDDGRVVAAGERITGLEAGRRYRYTIEGAGRVLARGSFRTDPGPRGRVTVAVFGDYGDGSVNERRVARLAASWNPDAFVSTGDNVYLFAAGGFLLDPNLFRPLEPLLRRTTFVPALGNHDTILDDGRAFLDAFALPGAERWYVHSAGPAAFIVLDSNSPLGPSSPQGRFLRTAIRETADSCLRFLVVHHPPFSPHSGGIADALRRDVMPLVERARFTAVLAGHVHIYDRSVPENGVPHIAVGTGGAEIGQFRSSRLEPARAVVGTYGALRLDIDGRRARGRFYAVDGRRLDTFNLTCR